MKANASAKAPSPSTDDDESRWHLWGPYMSDREWGTVRETGGAEGKNWTRLPYQRAAQTAYRFCEDGIFGVSDSECRICHAYAFWNYSDDHLKERFFGVGNDQGAHGEDVKEIYHHKAADARYRYLCAEYLYPHTAYPYRHIVGMEEAVRETNRTSTIVEDTSAIVSVTDFSHWYQEKKYFEMEFEMTKLTPDQLYFQLSVTNCSSKVARVVVMPMLFLRNTWSAGSQNGIDVNVKKAIKCGTDNLIVQLKDAEGNVTCFGYYYESTVATPEILLTHNNSRGESNSGDCRSNANRRHFKDSFNRYIVCGDGSELITNLTGTDATKAGICYRLKLNSKEQVKLRCCLLLLHKGTSAPAVNWRGLASKMEAVRVANMLDAYAALPTSLVPAEQDILHAAYTNLLWNRQYYPLDSMRSLWNLAASSGQLPTRLVTVPDKWEQPYLATWDSALHCLCLNGFDRQQALAELMLSLALIRPDGSMYSDEYRPHGVTPPLTVLAAIDVYGKCTDKEKITLGPKIYATLKNHLRWWLYRPDARGVPLIDGGICGVDYVTLFPRELVETGEGLIWAIFFTMRFLELTLAIYATPNIPITRTIELDLPDLIRHLGRLCSAFVKNIAQENGLYHPYWLDVAAASGSARATRSSLKVAAVAMQNLIWQNEAMASDDLDDISVSSCGIRGHLNSPASSASSTSTNGDIHEVNASDFLATESCLSSMDRSCFDENQNSEKKRCLWLHAYCYLPVICCCSLPNVSLQRSGAATSSTCPNLEALLAETFNDSSSWETRAPYIYTNTEHKMLFVSVLSSLQITELFEQLFSDIQFLSPYGIRTMSLMHAVDTATVRVTRPPNADASATANTLGSKRLRVLMQKFCPGASVGNSYGGNTNWYGSVNLPYNYLVLEAIKKWSTVLDRKFDMVEFPSYSGRFLQLRDIVHDLASRNVALFLPNAKGVIPSTGNDGRLGILLFETFDGETGKGHGARHKGGWSAIIARILMLMHNL